MGSSSGKGKPKKGKKVRVAFRRNRARPPRPKDWTRQAQEAEAHEIDARTSENLAAKGDLSRQRTITVHDHDDVPADLERGTVIVMRGLYADVDDGRRILPCTISRVLRTRLIEERHPVTVGDHVGFRVESSGDDHAEEGVIEFVSPRRGELRRLSGRRVQTIVANVDQAVIVTSAAKPYPKPHLIDRYIVASLAGGITPIICMNKLDIDEAGRAGDVLNRYVKLGIRILETSAVTGLGIDDLRGILADKSSVIVGQSGVGKSSLLNAVQPELELRIGDINEQLEKGRHTTTTASLIRMACGGYVVDTPGIRSFDLSTVPRNEYEAYFTEFADHIAHCKFPDCTHTHESDCAVKRAVEEGAIHPDRYGSYVRMFEEPAAPS